MKIVNNNTKTLIQDTDRDTYVKVEASADEDKIRFGSGGSERAILNAHLTLKVPFIGKHQSALTTSSDNLDISDKCIIPVNAVSGNVVIGGFTGGVVGQIIVLYKITGANSLVLEHSEGVGDEGIVTPDTNDLTFTLYGGAILVFNGTAWFVIAKI